MQTMSQPDVNPFAPPRADVDAGTIEPLVATSARLASRGTRLGGYLIDKVLLPMPIGIVVAIGVIFFRDHRELALALAIALGAVMMLGLAGYQWYLIATTGQTLAKKWLHIRVVRTDGSLSGYRWGIERKQALIAREAAVLIPRRKAAR